VRIKRLSACVLGIVLGSAGAASAQGPVVESTSNSGLLSGGSATVVVDAPAGLAAGDLLVACVAGVMATEPSDVSATDWTHVATVGGTASDQKVGMLWKPYGVGTDGATYTFTLTSTTGTSRRGIIFRISGADTTTPSNATASENTGSSAARTYASITTDTANSLAIGCMGWATSDTTYTPEGTLTNSVLIQRLAGDYKAIAAAATTTGALAGTGTSTSWRSIFWAVADAPTPSGSGTKRCTTLGVC